MTLDAFMSHIRTVLQGPADSPYPWCKAVMLPKLCRSWTRRAYTTKFFTELRDTAEVVPNSKNAHLLNTMEHERLLKQGLNPRKELVREFEEQAATIKRRSVRETGIFRACQFKIKRISKVS